MNRKKFDYNLYTQKIYKYKKNKKHFDKKAQKTTQKIIDKIKDFLLSWKMIVSFVCILLVISISFNILIYSNLLNSNQSQSKIVIKLDENKSEAAMAVIDVSAIGKIVEQIRLFTSYLQMVKETVNAVTQMIKNPTGFLLNALVGQDIIGEIQGSIRGFYNELKSFHVGSNIAGFTGSMGVNYGTWKSIVLDDKKWVVPDITKAIDNPNAFKQEVSNYAITVLGPSPAVVFETLKNDTAISKPFLKLPEYMQVEFEANIKNVSNAEQMVVQMWADSSNVLTKMKEMQEKLNKQDIYSSIDAASPYAAIKEMTKLMHMNITLQTEIISMLAKQNMAMSTYNVINIKKHRDKTFSTIANTLY